MARKHYSKFFSADFEGVNSECSAIEQEDNSVGKAQNLEYASSNNLRGRAGCQLAAIPGQFFGVYPYSYSRTVDRYKAVYQTLASNATITSTETAADGTVVTELIAINQDAWVLDTWDLSIVNVSATNPIAWYSSHGSGGKTYLTVTHNTPAATLLSYDCGTGLELPDGSYKSIYAFAVAIDALAQFSCAFTRTNLGPFAITNGDQTASVVGTHQWGSTYSVIVDSGHTFYPGDPICFTNHSAFPQLGYMYGFVTATTATTITFAIGGLSTAPQVKDNQILGYSGQSAAAFPVQAVQTSSSTPFTISFPYWRSIRGVPEFLRLSEGAQHGQTIRDEYKPPTFVSMGGCAFMGVTNQAENPSMGLVKYDGQSLYRAGLPKPTTLSVVEAAGGSLTALGTYKYKYFYKRIDAQGNIIEGTPIDPISITLTGANQTVTVTYGDIAHGLTGEEYAAGAAWVDTSGGGAFAYSSGASIPVTATAGNTVPTLGVGDPVFVKDATGVDHRSYVTNFDGSPLAANECTIKLSDTGTYNIPDGATISAGQTLVILRTLNGGNQYYELVELANNPLVTTGGTYSDTMADATLGARTKYIEPTIGKEHDPPPLCSLVCEHQGGLVVSGNLAQPNTVSYSIPGDYEYFPLASNSFDVPPTRQGPITAIASDTYDHLAVFKADSYYDVVGDLDEGSFTVQVRNSGDYGIPSQASIRRVQSVLIGLSKLGFVAVTNGQLDSQVFRKLNAEIVNQSWIFKMACAENDSYNRSYICSIPRQRLKTIPASDVNSYTFVIDYSRNKFTTFSRTYVDYVAPSGGMASIDESLYTLCLDRNASTLVGGIVYKRIPRFISPTAPRVVGDCFSDHGQAIEYILESQPINLGDPSMFRSPLRLRLFSVANDYLAENWMAFQFVVETGIFPDPSYLGNSNPGGLTSTISFNSIDDWYRDVKLPSAKCLTYMIRLTTNTAKTAPFFTGYEAAFSAAYDKEDLQL